ncbi:MAG: DUF4476 domain-containing protein [Flavobacteriales bacterium]
MTICRNIALAILVIFSHTRLCAQCRITIEAPDSLPFLFSVNDQQVNQLPVLAMTFNNGAAGKLNFKADFPSRPELSFAQTLTVKKDAGVSYSIERSKGALKFVLTSEIVVNVSPNDLSNTIAATEADSAQAEPQHNGCSPLVDDATYRQMHSLADEQHFEAKKLSTMITFIGTSCVRVDQLQYMMSKLSQEDSKLALLIASKDHIYDTENIRGVLDEFFLDRNKTKAVEIIEANR